MASQLSRSVGEPNMERFLKFFFAGVVMCASIIAFYATLGGDTIRKNLESSGFPPTVAEWFSTLPSWMFTWWFLLAMWACLILFFVWPQLMLLRASKLGNFIQPETAQGSYLSAKPPVGIEPGQRRSLNPLMNVSGYNFAYVVYEPGKHRVLDEKNLSSVTDHGLGDFEFHFVAIASGSNISAMSFGGTPQPAVMSTSSSSVRVKFATEPDVVRLRFDCIGLP